MLKSIPTKNDPNLYYSERMSYLIGELGNFKDFYQSLIDLAKEGKVEEAMEFLEKNNPELFIKQGKKIENRLIDIYKDKIMKIQSNYKLEEFYLSIELLKELMDYLNKKQKGENPVLSVVGDARHK